jgi:Icc protein
VRILHLTDLHLPSAVGVDAAASLAGLLADCRDLPALDAVVVSGDVTNDGSAQGYALATELVGGFARDRGLPVLFATGNHDDRAAFEAALGSGHRGRGGADGGRLLLPGTDLRAAVSRTGGWRLITLDSLLVGEVRGRLGERQLTALREELRAPYGDGTVLVLHHPPVWPDRAPQRTVGLQDATALAGVVAGTDVRLVLCGHFHAPLLGQLAGVPVWAGPAVLTRIHLDVPSGHDVAVRGAGATVVELGGTASPLLWTVQARDLRAGELVYAVEAS